MIVKAKLFQKVDLGISLDRQTERIQAFAKTIQTEVLDAMRGLVDERSLPPSFADTIQHIVQLAYEWNRDIKQSIGKYAFTPFLVESLSEWDPERMESFERLRRMHVPTGSKIIHPVSLGIMGSRSHGEGKPRVLYVQQKAQVLVKEWFAKTKPQHVATSPPPACPVSPPPDPERPRPRHPGSGRPPGSSKRGKFLRGGLK